jgi:hypothetical protein
MPKDVFVGLAVGWQAAHMHHADVRVLILKHQTCFSFSGWRGVMVCVYNELSLISSFVGTIKQK